MSFPWHVDIVEVSPRDGLQNETGQVSVQDRIRLVEALTDAGLRRIEAGSFVSPRHVPRMADTDAVLAGIERRRGVTYSVLVPNLKGLDAAVAAKADEVAVFASASESFSRRNLNASIEESLERYAAVAERAIGEGLTVRGYVSCVLGCPDEGHVPVANVVEVARRLVEIGCREVSLGDTIGVGTPLAARFMVAAVGREIGIGRVALHFHDTYGQALANVVACLEVGASVVDTSVAGLGGCPYARGASGNLATEDLVFALHGMGIDTGVDLDRLAAAGREICGALQRPPASKVASALAARLAEAPSPRKKAAAGATKSRRRAPKETG